MSLSDKSGLSRGTKPIEFICMIKEIVRLAHMVRGGLGNTAMAVFLLNVSRTQIVSLDAAAVPVWC